MTTPIPSAALLGSKRLLLVKSTASAVEAELLKATVSKTIVVPAYTRKDGTVVPAHAKTVHYDPSKDVGDVLAGKGSHSQKQAHKKLSKLEHWEHLEDSHKLAHILSSATNIQQKASASAAVSGWKASMLAGKKPTASQQAAFDALPADKQAELQAQVGKPVTAPVAAPVTEPVAGASAYQAVPHALGGLGNEGPVIHVDAPDYAAVEKALGLEPGSLEGEDSTTYTVKNAAGQTFSVYKHGGGLSVRTSGANKDNASAHALAEHLTSIGKPAEPAPAAVPLVAGADGQPKVFYHGGTGNVDSADLKPLTFFTSDKDTALSYVGNNSEDEKLHAVHLAIGKVATPEDVKAAANKVGLTGDDVGVDEEYHAGYEYLSPHLNPHVEKVLAELKKQGFDGAHFPTDFKLSGELMPGGSWVVFGKGQVVPASGDHGLQGVGAWAHLSQYKSQHPMFITAQAKAWLADNPGKGVELSSTLVDLGHLDIAKKLGVYTPPNWASLQEKSSALAGVLKDPVAAKMHASMNVSGGWYANLDDAGKAKWLAENAKVPLHTFPGAGGFQAEVRPGTGGTFIVSVKDTDSGEYLPTVKKFPDEAGAVEHAKKLSGAYSEAYSSDDSGPKEGDALGAAASNQTHAPVSLSGTKVANEDGKPLVVYHGTGVDFDSFSAGKVNYFTADKDAAAVYAHGFGQPSKNPKIHAVHLDIKNPKVLPLTESAKLSHADIENLKAQGFDGVFGTQTEFMASVVPIKNLGNGKVVTEAIPFSVEQIKPISVEQLLSQVPADESPKEGDTKPAADGGTLVLKDGHWVKQGGDAPAAKGDVFVLDSQYEKMNAGKWVVYNVSPDGEQVYMHKVGAKVPNAKNSATIPVATLQAAIAKGTAKKEAPAGATISGYKVTEDVNAVPMVHATTGDDALASIMASGFNLSNNSMYGKGVYFSDKDLSQSGGKYKTSLQVKLKPHKQLVLDSDLEVATALQKITGLSSGHLGSDKAREAFLSAGIGSLRFPVDGETYTVVLDPALIELPKSAPAGNSKLAMIPWDAQLLPDANSNAKSHNGQVAKIKAMAEAGDVAGLQAYVDAKAGAKQTYAKKQHLLAATALAALKEGGAPAAPAANPLTGMSAADAIAINTHMPQLKLKEAWIDANADKVGAQAEWAMAFNPAPTVTSDPAPAKAARLPASQKKLIDDIATWPDAKYHLADIVSGGNPVAAAYAQQLLDAKKATVSVDKPKPPTGIEEHSEAGAYLADAIYGLEHNDLPTLQDVITALQGEKPGHDEHKVLQFAKDAYKHVAGAAPAASKPADPTAAELAPMMEAINSAGSEEGAKKAALRYLNAFPDSQLAINQTHDALANAGHIDLADAFAKDGQKGLEAFKPAAPAGPSKVTAELFHNTSNGHNKFWAVSVNGNVVKTTYGKIGSKGQTTEKVFGSKAEAQSHATTLMLQKHKGGYVPAGKTEHEYAAPAADQGPKEGDTKQGADGMLVLKDGHWVKMSDKEVTAAVNGWQQAIINESVPTKAQAMVMEHIKSKDENKFLDALHESLPYAMSGDDDGFDEHAEELYAAAMAAHKQALSGGAATPAPAAPAAKDSAAWQLTMKDPSFSGVNTLMADMDGLSVYIAYEPESATFEVGQIHPGADEPEADHFSDPKKALDYLASMYGASVEMPSLGQVEKLTGKVSGEQYSPKVPKPAAFSPSGYESMDAWKQTGPQGGSNPGGRFRDEHGVEWYCKFPADEDIAKSEVLAAKLYAALGVSGQDCKLVTKGGKVGIASRWIDVKKGTAAQLAKLDGTASGFAADAWLANHDVVGLAFDNLQIGPDGKAHRVDAGGSLQYRAQGGKKAFGPTVSEIDSLRDPAINSKSAAVFGKMTEADITASVAKVLALPDSAITNLVNQYGPGSDADKLALAQTLIARKADLAKKYPKAAKAPKKRLDPTNLPVDAAMLPKPHDFENWNGPGQGLSSKAHVNKANAAIEYQILGVAQMGNLPKLQAFEYAQIDKETGQPNGKMLPIANHPSKHVVQYHADLVTMLDEMANPPEPLKVFQETDISTLEQLSAVLPPKKFGTTVDSVKSNEKLGFWVVLGVAPGAVNLAPKKFMAYSQAAIAAGYEKYKQGTSLAKHFIKSVQASGSYNDLFRNGKKTDHSGNLLSDVAKAALQHATTQPEGTSLYRWQKMTDAMVQKIMAAPEGTVFQATGPMCTSYDPTATKHFGTHRVTVRYAKGAKAVESFGSNGYQSEKEVTTLPNSRFVILKRSMVPDAEHGNPHKTRLELEVLMLPPDLGL